MNSLPTELLVSLVYITPNLFDITCTTSYDLVVQLHACALFECVDELEHSHTLTGTYVVDLNGFFVLAFQDTSHSANVSLSQVDDIDEVADARAVGSIIVVAEY